MRRALLPALAVLAVAAGASRVQAEDEPGADLVAVARSGVRPVECGGAARTRSTRWDRARTPGLGRYCDAIGRGYAVLSTDPAAAVERAELAEATLPGHAAPLLLIARAELRRARPEEAWKRFERARALEPRSLDAPLTLHDYAVCALSTGHREEALASYRALVPRADLVGSTTLELSIYVEAAAVAMTEKKELLVEAIGYLTEARRRTTAPGFSDLVRASLALALDRAGRPNEAATVLAEMSGPAFLEDERVALAAGKPSIVPPLPPGELDAMIALAAEKTDRELARERWTAFLGTQAGKTGPFAAHGRAHRDAVGGGHRVP